MQGQGPGPNASQVPPRLQVAGQARPQAAETQSALVALLKIEQDIREAATTRDLTFILSNEIRKLTRARQVFVLIPNVANVLEVTGISSLPSVDRNAPVVIWIEKLCRTLIGSQYGVSKPLPLPGKGEDASADSYPFRSLIWVPLKHAHQPPHGGLVLAREDDWTDQDLVIARRISAATAHAWSALNPRRATLKRRLQKTSKKKIALVLLGLFLLGFVHVPLSVIAPVEIVARDPFVVAAPIDGVIERVVVEADQAVKSGDLLVKLADTTLRNRFEIAEREVSVAQARLKQANQIAFNDAKGLHDIAIARAELGLKIAERDFARSLLDKTEIKSERAGIAIYSDKRELAGRPVSVGERILEVADSNQVEARIDLPVTDAIVLVPGSAARLFLDSDPLRPWSATITRADYKAKTGDNDVVSFRVTAAIPPEEGRRPPRLGVRGSSQITGASVPVWLFILRRPVTAVRQWAGL